MIIELEKASDVIRREANAATTRNLCLTITASGFLIHSREHRPDAVSGVTYPMTADPGDPDILLASLPHMDVTVTIDFGAGQRAVDAVLKAMEPI